MTDTQKNAIKKQDDDVIDIGQLIGYILDGKWIILTSTLIFFILGILYTILYTPVYQSDALIQVEEQSSGGFSSMVSENLGTMFESESTADAEITLIKSRMVLEATVDKFNLRNVIEPEYFPLVGKGIARLNENQRKIKLSVFSVENQHKKNSSFYELKVIDKNKGTYLLSNDEGVVLVKGKVGKKYNENGVTIQISDIKAESGFTFKISVRSKMDAISWLRSHLSVSEEGKQTGMLRLRFDSENPDFSENVLNDISHRYFLQNVARNSEEAKKSIVFLKEKLPQLKKKLVLSENKLNDYRKKRESVDLSMEAESTLKVMVNLDSQLNELTFKEAEISQKFTKDHPAYKSLIDKRNTLLKQKIKLNKKIESLPETQKEILSLQRDVKVNQQIYVQLLNKIEELSIVKAGTVGNVRIIDDAKVNLHPIKPKKELIVILTTFFGLVFGITLITIFRVLNKGVVNPDDIESIGLPVYANIPKSELQISLADKLKKSNVKHTTNGNLLAELNPADLAIEALRGLRTSLHFAMMEAKNNILMISGPAPSIGKSFVSTNFSAVYAKTGYKVLLIDADMRKGYLHQSLKININTGLSEYLSGVSEKENIITKSNIDNLDVITRGQVPPNPSELLMHSRMQSLLDWAASNYDLVIVDTPPILAVTDANIIGSMAGTTLMVARFATSTVKEIDVARSRFEQAGVKVKGVIFNAVEKTSSSQYGYGYYNYEY